MFKFIISEKTVSAGHCDAAVSFSAPFIRSSTDGKDGGLRL